MKRDTVAFAIIAAALASGCSKDSDYEAAMRRINELEGQLAAEKAKNEQLQKPIEPIATVTTTAPAAVTIQPEMPVTEATPATEEIGRQWIYDFSEDSMSGGIIYRAVVYSSNSVSFDFPYSGAQNGRLMLRTHPKYGKDVIFSIERGQFLCPSYQGCSVQVRFDENKPITLSANGPDDNSSETVFIENYDLFISKLRKAKRVRISANIYKEGSPVFEFDVSGFSIEKYKPKKR